MLKSVRREEGCGRGVRKMGAEEGCGRGVRKRGAREGRCEMK